MTLANEAIARVILGVERLTDEEARDVCRELLGRRVKEAWSRTDPPPRVRQASAVPPARRTHTAGKIPRGGNAP